MPQVMRISCIHACENVYDISSEAGSFCLANGAILKNTDSVYVQWIGADMKKAFELSSQAAQVVTKTFKEPIQLEFEKVMCPLFLYTKKRYTYQMWENYETPNPKIQQIGTQMIRRDTCKYAREVLAKITEFIIKDRDQDAALLYTRKAIADLLEGKTSMDDLILTRNLKDKYKNENIPHVKLAKRMQARNDVNKVTAGERISMLHIDDANIVEDPQFVRDNNLRINYMHYFQKQLKTPIDMIWGLIMDSSKVYSDIVLQAEKDLNKTRSIEGFLKLFHKE